MAKQIKPVALLSPSATRSKNQPSAKSTTTEAGRISDAEQVADKIRSSAGPRLLGWFLLIVALALVLTPKPELIVYQQQNIQAKSVYWPGVFGWGAGLSDSQMLVYVDDERHEMRLCYAGELAVQCSKYHIVHRGGLLEVGAYLMGQR